MARFDFKPLEFSYRELDTTYPTLDFKTFVLTTTFKQKWEMFRNHSVYMVYHLIFLCLGSTFFKIIKRSPIRGLLYALRKLPMMGLNRFVTRTSSNPLRSEADYAAMITDKYRPLSIVDPDEFDYGWTYANFGLPIFTRAFQNIGEDELSPAAMEQLTTCFTRQFPHVGSLEDAIKSGQVLICCADRIPQYRAFMYQPDSKSDKVSLFASGVHDTILDTSTLKGKKYRLFVFSHLCSELSRLHFNVHFIFEVFLTTTYQRLQKGHPLYDLIAEYDSMSFLVMSRARRTIKRDTLMYSAFVKEDLEQIFTFYHDKGVKGFIDWSLEGKEGIAGLYPHRDDRVAIEALYLEFATEYVEEHYKDDAAVKADTALHAWNQALGTEGRIPERLSHGLETRGSLIDLIVQFMTIATHLHYGTGHEAMVNAQVNNIKDFPAFYDEKVLENDEADLLAGLPDLDRAVNIIFLCNAFHVDPRNELLPRELKRHEAIDKAKLAPVYARFFHKLLDFEETVIAANKERYMTLLTMIPSLLPKGVQD